MLKKNVSVNSGSSNNTSNSIEAKRLEPKPHPRVPAGPPAMPSGPGPVPTAPPLMQRGPMPSGPGPMPKGGSVSAPNNRAYDPSRAPYIYSPVKNPVLEEGMG